MAVAAPERQDTEAVRHALAAEREQLVEAVNELRRSSDLAAQVREKLPLLLAGAFMVGFVLSGGIGATMRLIFRRGREGRTAARVGDLAIVKR